LFHVKLLQEKILEKDPQNEIQKVDLQNRKEIIEAGNYTTGFDGSKVWLAADTSYKRNPVFYHNLMFYFIAMPFVLADDGIVFKGAQPLEFDGVTYPGLRIAYEDDIGMSPEDEYFIHYNPDTYRMEWLGYTVTYFSKEKSTDIHWIRYQDWKMQNGLLLPNSLDWYKYENGWPTEFRNKVELANFKVLESKYDQSIFEKIDGAEFVE